VSQHLCELCGAPMPPGEEMFKYHGYSGDCPRPPLPRPLKAGIAVDDWKLPIFERHLSQAGYRYEKAPLMMQTTLLTVLCDSLATIEPIVRAANDEAARSKMD
jgi:hypothetical protein